MNELAEHFSLERVQKAGAKFDPEKTRWFNQQYLKTLSNEEIMASLMPLLNEKKIEVSYNYVMKVVEVMRERIFFVKDIFEDGKYFFLTPEEYDKQIVVKKWTVETPALLSGLAEELKYIEDFTATNIEMQNKTYCEKKGLQAGQVMNALRLVIVVANTGPGIFQIIEIIGKEETLLRIKKAVMKIRI